MEEEKKRGRKHKHTGKTIYVKVEGNPCRKGSKRSDQFELVTEGMAFEDYLKAGGTTFNLNDGINRGYFELR